jgi:hypothetical protein
VHSSLVQGQDRLAFSFTAKWQAEWKGAGSVGRWLSVTSYTSSHLPTHWHFTPKKKKIREASWLRRLRHQRCTVPVWRTGDFDRPISTFKQHSAQHEESLTLVRAVCTKVCNNSNTTWLRH